MADGYILSYSFQLMIWLHCVSSSVSCFEADMECSMERLLILVSPSGLLFTVIGSESETEPLRWIHQVVPLLWFWPIAVWFFICKWWKSKPANIPLPQLLPHITEIGKKYDSFLHTQQDPGTQTQDSCSTSRLCIPLSWLHFQVKFTSSSRLTSALW